ncbi:8-oxoguanine deaminase [Micromonospora parathelypteridis]|uniref:Cytosine/adenosine deaminase-related metal-dependent hydrolase n=1 Tax=Micromonospora parathelypteridis TaxID=1839617 RepID=A0A840W6X9_9ACTN|nr:8-oxoguanine deaminase [Micromonospora parathelypteridis]MBB5480818.1 cytosine/adenosine deaminase-related metal-dependent hydrolase [Micromonospora parathelypteridis]
MTGASRPLAIEGCAIATVNGSGTEYEYGHMVVENGRIAKIGPGPLPMRADVTRIDGRGCLATPGLVNVHHHLYQWATRGLAQDHDLFGWLTSLYPMWASIDVDLVRDTTAAGLAWLALSGCTTSADHPYIFPDRVGDLLAAEVAEAGRIGLRLHLCRGAIDLGHSRGGLPPDELVENTHDCLSAMKQAVSDFHDPSPGAMVRVAIAPCSPFSVSAQLMAESAALARDMGVRLHTHLAETIQEEHYCKDKFGVTPVRYLERLGWLADDVWLAHGVHLSDDAIETMAKEGVAVAHCPSSNARLGAGIAPVRRMLDAGIAVGLGVDGPASQESGLLVAELRQAMYSARLDGGPTAMSARDALRMGTMGGAHCLGRQDEIGSLEVGKLADIALWRLDTLGHAGIADPVAALVFGPPAGLARLLVHGREVVVDGELQTADITQLTKGLEESCRRLATRH